MPSFERLTADELAPVMSALGMPSATVRPVEVL
jgi:hypothetical protein